MSDIPDTEQADEPTTTGRPFVLAAVLAVVLAAAIGGVLIVQARRDDSAATLAARRAQVEQKGAQVMPFDQSRTTHQFTKTDTGGVQSVTTNDPGDAQQAALVQAHLQAEKDRFASGDFTDPMAIHGQQMPGITELAAGARSGQVTVSYEVLPNGARLTYTATTPALVDALHAWFDAQLLDHGAHATG